MARLVWRTGDDRDWLVEPKPAGSALVVQQRDEDQWGRIERTRRLRVFAQRDRLDQRYGCPCLSVVGGPGPACRAAEETGSEVDQRRHRWFACANRVCCVFISRPSQTALYSLWEKCWQNHLDTPKGPHLGAINRTTTGHIPKPLPRDRGPAWRRRLHRRSAFETSTASASADSARLTVPARGHWGPLRLPGEKSHEPCSTHPRRPPRNRDWLLRSLSSGFGCLLS